jgi:hypothetical protein
MATTRSQVLVSVSRVNQPGYEYPNTVTVHRLAYVTVGISSSYAEMSLIREPLILDWDERSQKCEETCQ